MPELGKSNNWDAGGWAGAEASTRREGAKLSLYEKILWLEEIEEVFLNLQRSRRDQEGATLLPKSPVLNEQPASPDAS